MNVLTHHMTAFFLHPENVSHVCSNDDMHATCRKPVVPSRSECSKRSIRALSDESINVASYLYCKAHEDVNTQSLLEKGAVDTVFQAVKISSRVQIGKI